MDKEKMLANIGLMRALTKLAEECEERNSDLKEQEIWRGDYFSPSPDGYKNEFRRNNYNEKMR